VQFAAAQLIGTATGAIMAQELVVRLGAINRRLNM
jgi:hypothetical protein